jgi:hypothetical protein
MGINVLFGVRGGTKRYLHKFISCTVQNLSSTMATETSLSAACLRLHVVIDQSLPSDRDVRRNCDAEDANNEMRVCCVADRDRQSA